MQKGLEKWIKQSGGLTNKQYNALMTRGSESLSGAGQDANVFSQQLGAGTAGSALAGGVSKYGSDLMTKFIEVAGHRGTAGAIGNLVNYMAGSGTSLKGAQNMISYAAKLTGATPAQINAMMAEVKKDYTINVKAHAQGAGEIQNLKNEINQLHDKEVKAKAHGDSSEVRALAAQIAALHNKIVTITAVVNTVRMTSANNPYAGGISGRGMQTGGLVPGSGSGDIIPAMLEPGEVVIPRSLVGLVAPILAAHRVPGFGGMPQGASSHFAAGGIVPLTPHVLGFHDPVDLSGNAGKIAWTLIDGITKALNSAGAKKIADALVNKIGQEVAYAKNVASAAMQGQGYGNAGIFGSMDVTPGTGNGTVMQQMQSYLTTVQSFTKDIGTLRKDHLNKAIISQLIGAGPVQGDALAQSILGGYGGVKGVNQLWAQLGHATKGLGNQAELAQYGGLKASSANVTININAGSGGAAGLTTAQIKQIVAQVQAALLKQAKRNPKTGIQLAGKGA